MAAVDIYIHQVCVGHIAHQSDFGDATEFRLAEDYKALHSSTRPVLGQIFEDRPDFVWRTTHRIPPWFSNLLPEGRLRQLLAEQAGVNPERELHLLAELGEDLPGAVVVRPQGERLDSAPIRPSLEVVRGEDALRFSLAGMQLKFSVERDDRGLTLPVRGQGGRWIAKLPDPRYSAVPENEFAMLTWASAAGLDVPNFILEPTNSINGLPESARSNDDALLIRRFDRTDAGERIHIEDFAQIRDVMGANKKYSAANFENVGHVLYALDGERSLREYVGRLVFMLLSGNADMHLKNWSLIYPDGRTPRIAPAYDLVSTLVFEGTSRRMALKLGKTHSFHKIDRTVFERLARKVGCDSAVVLGWLEEFRQRIGDEWATIRNLLPGTQAQALEVHMNSLRI